MGQIIDTIPGKKFLSLASLIIGLILFAISLLGIFSFVGLIAIACAIACFIFGVQNMFNSIELYEEAIVIKSLSQRTEIRRKQIDMINFGKYDPEVYDFDRYEKPQLKIVTIDGTVSKIPYTAYKDLYNKLRSYQRKYNIPDQNSFKSV